MARRVVDVLVPVALDQAYSYRLADGLARGKSEAAAEAGVSVGVVDGLIDEGTLGTLVLPPEPVARPPDPDFSAPDFTPAQRAVADELRDTLAAGGYSATLLDGV